MERKMVRLSQVDLLYKANSVKTFNNEVYELKGTLAINRESGDIQPISAVYYNVRTAINKAKVIIAKRKHITDELIAL